VGEVGKKRKGEKEEKGRGTIKEKHDIKTGVPAREDDDVKGVTGEKNTVGSNYASERTYN